MNGNLKCPLCGGELAWHSDQNAADVSDEYEGDESAIVSYYTCSRCGRDFEIFDPTKEERENEYRGYWNNESHKL